MREDPDVPPSENRSPLPALIPFLIVSGVHLAGHLASFEPLAMATKPLLIPLLAGAVLWLSRGRRSSGVILLLAALLFSWLGDLALLGDGDSWFLIGLGCFLVAHLGYVALFFSRVGSGKPAVWSIVYAAWFALLLVILVPHLGGMLAPVVGYGLVICTMAAIATRCGWMVSLGAALFLLSDSILAVNAFVDAADIPVAGFLVMLTYLSGQGFIAIGIMRLLGSARRTEPVAVGSDTR